MRILLLFFLLPLRLLAQHENINQEFHNTFNLSAGPSFPTGDFVSKKIEKGGFATTGVNLNMFAYFKVYNEVFITSTIAYSNFSADEGAMVKALNDKIPGNYEVNTSTWGSLAFMIGPSYCFLGKHFSLDLKFQIGLSSNNSPSLNINNRATSRYISYPEAEATSFMYGPGATLRTALGERFYFITNVDYFTTEAVFYSDIAFTSQGLVQPTYQNTISFITASIGLAFVLK
jgi:hypothetical protein